MLRFSAKLDRLDTEGEGFREDVSLRGVGSGVVDVEDMAEVLMDCGRITGDCFCCCEVGGLPAWPGCDDAFAEGEDCDEGCAILKWSLCVLAMETTKACTIALSPQHCADCGSTVRLVLRVSGVD